MKKQYLLDEIYSKYISGSSYDIGMGARPVYIDYALRGSYNIDFRIEIEQTWRENVYFNITLYNYNDSEEVNLGYFYIKNYSGKVDDQVLGCIGFLYKQLNKLAVKIFETPLGVKVEV